MAEPGRYEINYDPTKPDVARQLAELGVGIIFNSRSSGKIVASIYAESVERARGLAGVLDVKYSPLEDPSPRK